MSVPLSQPGLIASRLEINSRERAVLMTWEDGHESEYAFAYLRGYCPCAVCQGHGGSWDFVEGASSQLKDVMEVGHYALNFVWDAAEGSQKSEQHRTGIYPFELLRALCACEACLKHQGIRHPWARLTPSQKSSIDAGK